MLGSGYVIEHCLSAFQKQKEEEQFKEYIADGVYLVANNFAEHFGGRTLTIRYRDLKKKSEEKKEERTEQEIISSIQEKMKALNNERI